MSNLWTSSTGAGAFGAGLATEATLLSVLANQTNGLQLAVVDVTDRVGRILGHVQVDTSALPAGAATEATLATRLADATFTARINTLGQKTMALSTPVVLASDQTAIPITDNAGSLTVDTPQLPAALVGGRLDGNVGAWLGSTAPTVGQKTMVASIPVAIASDQTAIPITDNAGSLTVDTPQLPAALVGGRLDGNVGAWLGSTAPTVGQKVMASSIPIVVASDQTSLPTTEARLPAALVGGRLDCNLGAWLGSTAPTVGQKTMANSVPVVIPSDQSAIPVTAPTLTKGTQGANGWSTQDLKDAGRTRVSIIFQAVAPAVADTLLTLVKVSAGTAAGGATSIGVAGGKTLRITSITFSLKAGAAAAAFATLTIRQNPAGATVIGSQSELRVDLGNTAATIGASDNVTIAIPDGLEFSGANTLGASLAAQAVTNIISISLNGFEY